MSGFLLNNKGFMEKCLKSESDTKMVNPNNQMLTEGTPLLTLDDRCLIEISQYLELSDLMNLHKTCRRLKDVCASVCALRYNKVKVFTQRVGSDYNEKITKQQFCNVLSVIGQHVLSVEINEANDFILETIRDSCKNLNKMEVCSCEESDHLQNIRNMKELRLGAIIMDTDELKNLLENNLGLEILECRSGYGEDFIQLLEMLPKLKCLEGITLRNQDLQHVLRLDGLSKLSFRSNENCNQLLIGLSERLNLTELNINMEFDGYSLGIIKAFGNLKVLSIDPRNIWNKKWFSDATVLPPTLKHLKVDKIKISCSDFLAMVKQLHSLEEFDVGRYGDIFWDHSECKLSCQNYM